jgi:hypothetical protein
MSGPECALSRGIPCIFPAHQGKSPRDRIGLHFTHQQAPAGILMDINQRLSDSKRWRPVLYCGMTQAMVRLELLVQDGTGLQERLSI